jgi:hypothetical protein
VFATEGVDGADDTHSKLAAANRLNEAQATYDVADDTHMFAVQPGEGDARRVLQDAEHGLSTAHAEMAATAPYADAPLAGNEVVQLSLFGYDQENTVCIAAQPTAPHAGRRSKHEADVTPHDPAPAAEFLAELQALDLFNMTPFEAMQWIHDMQRKTK